MRHGPAEVRASAAIIVAAVIDDGRSLDDVLAAETRRRLGARAQALAVLRHAALARPAGRGAQRAGRHVRPTSSSRRLRALIEIGLFQLISGETRRMRPFRRPSAPPGARVREGGRLRQRDPAAVPARAGEASCTRSTATWRCAPRIRAGSSMRCAATGRRGARAVARRQQRAPAAVGAREPHARRRRRGAGRARGRGVHGHAASARARRAAGRAARRRALAAGFRGWAALGAGRRRPAGRRTARPAGRRAHPRCLRGAGRQDLPRARADQRAVPTSRRSTCPSRGCSASARTSSGSGCRRDWWRRTSTNVRGWWDGRPYDRVLLDVPCSATGVIRRHPDIKILRRAKDIPALARRQANLLAAAWGVVKPGGPLLYTSCSVLAAENERVVAAFLARTPGGPDLTPELTAGWPARPPGRARVPGPARRDRHGRVLLCLPEQAAMIVGNELQRRHLVAEIAAIFAGAARGWRCALLQRRAGRARRG